MRKIREHITVEEEQVSVKRGLELGVFDAVCTLEISTVSSKNYVLFTKWRFEEKIATISGANKISIAFIVQICIRVVLIRY